MPNGKCLKCEQPIYPNSGYCRVHHLERAREYNHRPEVKARQRARSHRPDIKAKNNAHQKEYNKRPEVRIRQRERNKMYDRMPKAKFGYYQQGAKERGISFNLTFEQFMSFWQKPCFITGCTEVIQTIGLDRIDNTKGYALENIRPCCKVHNKMKSNYTDAETYKLAKQFTNWFEAQETNKALCEEYKSLCQLKQKV